MNSSRMRVNFVAAWFALLLAKLALAASVTVFVDEAFYAWEARHPALAYSDLPGLTAWLARAGLVFGDTPLALRLPFLALGAAVPWLVRRLAARVVDARSAEIAGLLALLMPLSGALGVLALPDVPLVFAALLCMDSVLALRERVAASALVALALGLVMGALSHYRFALVLLAGGVAIASDPRARRLLAEPRVWLVLAIGAAAWWPALQWNLAHQGAGIRFHLLERNPWSFHADGVAWLPIQMLVVTPPLFLLLCSGLRQGFAGPGGGARLLAVAGAVSAPALLLLAFFADEQRVSFHWPLSGWLVLMPLAAAQLPRWRAGARWAVVSFAGLGLALALAFLAVAASAPARTALAGSRLYPNDFAGWGAIARDAKSWPSDRPWIAGDFELAAQLAFATGRSDVRVLDSPLNHKHGRAAQLSLWGLDSAPVSRPVLLAVDDSATPMKDRLALYHGLCAQFGPLPPARQVSDDHGRKRYFVYAIDEPPRAGACVAPALSYVDAPSTGQRVDRKLHAAGWAFKEGVGLRAVEVLVDGRKLADAEYGLPMPGVAAYWRDSVDPRQPDVGWKADLDLATMAPGQHWLGLRLHGADGSVETSAEQPFVLR